MNEHGQTDANWSCCYDYWVYHGYRTLEDMLEWLMPKTGFAFDDRPTVADIYLVPQLFNARRVGVDLSAHPLI